MIVIQPNSSSPILRSSDYLRHAYQLHHKYSVYLLCHTGLQTRSWRMIGKSSTMQSNRVRRRSIYVIHLILATVKKTQPYNQIRFNKTNAKACEMATFLQGKHGKHVHCRSTGMTPAALVDSHMSDIHRR